MYQPVAQIVLFMVGILGNISRNLSASQDAFSVSYITESVQVAALLAHMLRKYLLLIYGKELRYDHHHPAETCKKWILNQIK